MYIGRGRVENGLPLFPSSRCYFNVNIETDVSGKGKNHYILLLCATMYMLYIYIRSSVRRLYAVRSDVT